MLEQLGNVFTEVLSWVGEFVTALTATDGALAPLLVFFLIGVGVTILFTVGAFIRRITWGA